ncbi:MAG: ABC transporter ATP-binding protein, partial [Muribaculaceae bacterium]|nr:ABC transporter ATP-binding protein [Muribaculaceae bacterium]
NDLDITTLEVLEDYLANFKGCVIVVSHDRFFIDRIVDHTFVFTGNGTVKDFPGNYSEYRAWKEAHPTQETTSTKPKEKPVRQTVHTSAPKLSYKEKKELETLIEEISRLNQEKAELDEAFSGGEVNDIATKAARYEEVKRLLDEKELRWLELSEKVQ